MHSSIGISEGYGAKCSHPQEFQRGLKKNSFKKGFNTNHLIHRGGVHIKWNGPLLQVSPIHRSRVSAF